MIENKIEKNTKVIQKYADKMILGDIEAKKLLVDYYFDLAYKLYEKEFKDIYIEKDDLKQMAYLSVLNGINAYRPQHYSFSTYVASYIKNDMKRKLKHQQNSIDSISIGLDIKPENNYDNFFETVEDKDLVMRAINNLEKRNQDILYKYFFEEKSQEFIAQIYGVSSTAIHQLIKTSLAKIKGELLFYKTLEKLKLKTNKINFYNFSFFYFEDYSKEEITNAINFLSKDPKTYLRETNINNTYDPHFYAILKKIESILIKERRKSSLKTNKCKKIVRK